MMIYLKSIFIKQKLKILFWEKEESGFMIKWMLYSTCRLLTFEMESFIGYGMIES